MTFDKGPHDFSGGAFACLLPDGQWGKCDTELVRRDGESLLVATPYRPRADLLEQLDWIATCELGMLA